MDRPILFSGPMVRALLAGTKTQTRRVLNPQPNMLNGRLPLNNGRGSYSTDGGWTKYRFAIGDRLYVRETWRCNGWATDVATVMYRASEDGGYTAMTEKYPVAGKEPMRVTGTWRPSIHMPRWASRLTLTVTDVRVQRLQETTVEDAVAEGALSTADVDQFARVHAIPQYQAIWDGLNAERGFGWSTNPWVVAVSFTVERHNIDAEKR
jgi:hypothetical protein